MGEWPAKAVVCPILIGRGSSLRALDALAAQARAGHGGVVLVAGEAGIGKSRLVAEAAARVGAEPEPTGPMWRLQGHCFEPDQATPYAPFVDLLRGLLAAHPADELAAALGPAA